MSLRIYKGTFLNSLLLCITHLLTSFFLKFINKHTQFGRRSSTEAIQTHTRNKHPPHHHENIYHILLTLTYWHNFWLACFFSSFYIYFICCCCFIYGVLVRVWRSTLCIHACMKNVNAGMLQHWIFMSTNEVWPTWKYCDVVFMLYKCYFNVTFIKVMLRNSVMDLGSSNACTRAFSG